MEYCSCWLKYERLKRSRLYDISKIQFGGPINPEPVPAYMKDFDVAINPQVITLVTGGNYLRKIDEYHLLGQLVFCFDN